MEPTRQCLLVLGLLFVFFGSETGQAICLRAYRIVRFWFYLSLALIAAICAIFFKQLGMLLLKYSERKRTARKS